MSVAVAAFFMPILSKLRKSNAERRTLYKIACWGGTQTPEAAPRRSRLRVSLEGLSEGADGQTMDWFGRPGPCGHRQGPFAAKRSPERLTRVFHARKGSGEAGEDRESKRSDQSIGCDPTAAKNQISFR